MHCLCSGRRNKGIGNNFFTIFLGIKKRKLAKIFFTVGLFLCSGNRCIFQIGAAPKKRKKSILFLIVIQGDLNFRQLGDCLFLAVFYYRSSPHLFILGSFFNYRSSPHFGTIFPRGSIEILHLEVEKLQLKSGVEQWLPHTDRVTRLGEFLPMGDCLIW
jgi:hypothetical protein